jgi:hypothetical protein
VRISSAAKVTGFFMKLPCWTVVSVSRAKPAIALAKLAIPPLFQAPQRVL